MSRGYRPEGWKSPYEEDMMSPTESVKLQTMTHNLAYEHGADAMLQALAKEVDGNHIWFGRTDSGDLLIYMGLEVEK